VASEITPAKPASFGEAYDWAAAPQAIEAHISERVRKRRRLDRELLWLSNLLAERNEQIAEGEWPPEPKP
jgi:hypothetical protein